MSSSTRTTPEPSVVFASRARLEGERQVELVRPQEAAGRAADQDRTGASAAGDAAGELDQLAQRRAERHLVDAGALDVAAQAEELRAGRVLGADLRVRRARPASTMSSTLTSVSTLLTTVGLPKRPSTTGNGGLLRGSPR